MNPILKMTEWLDNEKKLGSLHPDRMVLATTSQDCIAHSRIIAIRDISDKGILFFTQRGSRKVTELHHTPHVSMTLWLPMANLCARPLYRRNNVEY
ncbi:MAG: pyridoxamine 5'-phosphate oxidase family protein [Gammaproteobacteria bacterium]